MAEAKLYRSKHAFEAVQLTAEHFEDYKHRAVPLPLGACFQGAKFSPEGKCVYGFASVVGSATAEIGDFIIRDDQQRGMVRRPEAFLRDFEVDTRPALLEACKGLIAEDIVNARDIIEFGPGGTTEEFAAQKLIDEREAAARAAIAAAE